MAKQMHDDYGEMQETRNKVHGYLGLNINFYDAGKVKIDMVDYIRNIIDECTENINLISPTPASVYVFNMEK